MKTTKEFFGAIKGCVLFGVIAVFAVPLLGLFGLWLMVNRAQRYILLRRVKREWIPVGKIAVLVTTNEPKWQQYLQVHATPQRVKRMEILNWSERRTWIRNEDLGTKLFKNYNWGQEWLWGNNRKFGRRRAGGRALRHMAIVFRPWYRPRVLTFADTSDPALEQFFSLIGN